LHACCGRDDDEAGEDDDDDVYDGVVVMMLVMMIPQHWARSSEALLVRGAARCVDIAVRGVNGVTCLKSRAVFDVGGGWSLARCVRATRARRHSPRTRS
jgi:hypothetical protein